MRDEKVFKAKGVDAKFWRTAAIIMLVFFAIFHAEFFDSWASFFLFLIFFSIFIVFGVALILWSEKRSVVEIRMNPEGFSYSKLKEHHGVEIIPWKEVEGIDVISQGDGRFHYLRIGLRDGELKRGLKKSALDALTRGRDINVLLSVDAPSSEVRQVAKEFWEKTR